jgi:hypothetical protein
MTNTRIGYAIDIKLREFTKNDVNNGIMIEKEFEDPRSSTLYRLALSPSFACAPGPASNCVVKNLEVRLFWRDPNGRETQTASSFPIKTDSTFEASISVDWDKQISFALNCAVAAKIRKSGGIFSDSFFDVE